MLCGNKIWLAAHVDHTMQFLEKLDENSLEKITDTIFTKNVIKI